MINFLRGTRHENQQLERIALGWIPREYYIKVTGVRLPTQVTNFPHYANYFHHPFRTAETLIEQVLVSTTAASESGRQVKVHLNNDWIEHAVKVKVGSLVPVLQTWSREEHRGTETIREYGQSALFLSQNAPQFIMPIIINSALFT